MRIKRILVTGSSGTIGTRLCEKLLESGYEVVGVDRRPNRWSDSVNKVTVLGDLLDENVLQGLSGSFHMVMHLAANVRIYNSVLDPGLAMENLKTTFNVLEFCRHRRIRRFFFSSSREVYGNYGDMVRTEDQLRINNCESPYTASKMGGEALVHSYQKCYGIDFVIMRFSNVYGMYDDSDRLVPVFIKLTKDNKDLVVYGKEKELDFTYIDDAISGVIGCIERFGDVKNDVYNIASGKATNLVDVARIVQEKMNSKKKVKLGHNRTGEVLRYEADITKARSKLGYEPRVDIGEGIGRSITWYIENLYR